jgi:hypothetical protein
MTEKRLDMEGGGTCGTLNALQNAQHPVERLWRWALSLGRGVGRMMALAICVGVVEGR